MVTCLKIVAVIVASCCCCLLLLLLVVIVASHDPLFQKVYTEMLLLNENKQDITYVYFTRAFHLLVYNICYCGSFSNYWCIIHATVEVFPTTGV